MNDPLFSVDGLGVVLTGACGLIGSAASRALSERGARVLAVDVAEADLDGLAEEVRGLAGTAACDVSGAVSVAGLVERAAESLGRVDVLINAHQYKVPAQLKTLPEEFPEEIWDRMLAVNLKGVFLTCRDFGRGMLAQGGGSIINFASTYGVVSSNPALYEDNSMGNPVAYSASKGGVLMLSKYLAAQWADRGVRVNCVTPHGVYAGHEPAFVERFSRMSPMGRMMTAEEAVGAILFLASGASSYATGGNLLVEGGWTAW